MLRSGMQRFGVVCLVGLLGTGARSAVAQPTPTLRLGRQQCVRERPRERTPRRFMCHVGGNYILRFADSAGVGEGLHPSGPRLIALAAVPCQNRALSSAGAVLQCTVGTQQIVLDSAGVGEGAIVTSDSAGVGEGLLLDASMCKWVVLAGYGPNPVLKCMFGTIPIVIDPSRVAR